MGSALHVRRANWMEWALTTFTGSTVPAADATTTALSLLATYGQGRKVLQSWWLTALLYSIFLGACRPWSWRDRGCASPRQVLPPSPPRTRGT